jgi:hypothetical protein
MHQSYTKLVTGMTIPSEPTVEWQRNGISKSNEQLQQQLGIRVSHKDYRDRQIMKLEVGVHNTTYSKSMSKPYNFAFTQALLGYSRQGGWR